MTTTTLELWQDPDGLRAARRAERERRRQRNRLIGIGSLAFAVVFGAVLIAAVIVNKPTQSAGASDSIPATSSTSIAAEWGTSTTIPTPETLPAPVVPQWVQIKVVVPGWDGLGKLVTDGQLGHCDRVLPGQLGRAVITIPFDPTSAGTIVVEGHEYRVFARSGGLVLPVAADDLSICDVHPIFPTVMLVSSLPGDARPFVEAKADTR